MMLPWMRDARLLHHARVLAGEWGFDAVPQRWHAVSARAKEISKQRILENYAAAKAKKRTGGGVYAPQ